MQCFLYVTYLIITCTALPAQTPKPQEQRSLFQDVINSLKINSHRPEDLSQNYENNLSVQLNYDVFKYDSDDPDLHLPSDVTFVPRRNDRIEILPLKHRKPKTITEKREDPVNDAKEEFVLYITTTKDWRISTQKPKKSTNNKRPKPGNQVNNSKNKNQEDVDEENENTDENNVTDNPTMLPSQNNLSGQSQIGNRDSQIVVKPTVIINFRGSVNHKDSDIRLVGRQSENNQTKSNTPNVFNISQEIKLDKTYTYIYSDPSNTTNGTSNHMRVHVKTVELNNHKRNTTAQDTKKENHKKSDEIVKSETI